MRVLIHKYVYGAATVVSTFLAHRGAPRKHVDAARRSSPANASRVRREQRAVIPALAELGVDGLDVVWTTLDLPSRAPLTTTGGPYR